VLTLNQAVNIPESRITGELGLEQIISGSTFYGSVNVNPGVPQDVTLHFTFHTQVAAINGNVITTTRPINIPTSSFNDIYLRFSMIGLCPAKRFHVGTIEALDSGELVTGTGVPTGTTVQAVLEHTHHADPSHQETKTNIVFLDVPTFITQETHTVNGEQVLVDVVNEDYVDATASTVLTFAYQVFPVQVDAGTPNAWLEEGGSNIIVRFVKPSKTSVPFRMQTGHMQVVNEDIMKGADKQIDRSFSLIYTPTYGDKDIALLERYNGWTEPRSNEMRRERGGPGAFVHSQDSASTILNMNREASSLGFATGVAKAKFASRSNADMTGTDQHIQVELFGLPSRGSQWERTNFFKADTTVNPPLPCVLHQIVIEGVIEE
jgi:hypothetical protein